MGLGRMSRRIVTELPPPMGHTLVVELAEDPSEQLEPICGVWTQGLEADVEPESVQRSRPLAAEVFDLVLRCVISLFELDAIDVMLADWGACQMYEDESDGEPEQEPVEMERLMLLTAEHGAFVVLIEAGVDESDQPASRVLIYRDESWTPEDAAGDDESDTGDLR